MKFYLFKIFCGVVPTLRACGFSSSICSLQATGSPYPCDYGLLSAHRPYVAWARGHKADFVARRRVESRSPQRISHGYLLGKQVRPRHPRAPRSSGVLGPCLSLAFLSFGWEQRPQRTEPASPRVRAFHKKK